MRPSVLALSAVLALGARPAAQGRRPERSRRRGSPPSSTARTSTGWHGMPHFDPRSSPR